MLKLCKYQQAIKDEFVDIKFIILSVMTDDKNNIPLADESKIKPQLTIVDVDRIIEMAWEDRTSFDAIKEQFGLKEQEVIELMRKEMKLSSFKLWRQRVQGRKTKHEKLMEDTLTRFKSTRQRQITLNKISKRG
jgi:uncharacterized protein (TIGR03643 family)